MRMQRNTQVDYIVGMHIHMHTNIYFDRMWKGYLVHMVVASSRV